METYDGAFDRVSLSVDAFTDPHLPDGYTPFNIVPVTINGSVRLFVTFAVADADREDDVAGQGHGIVDTFDLAGHLLDRFAQHGQLDSPWGVTLAPAGFGEFGGALWIGNFGNGQIDAYRSRHRQVPREGARFPRDSPS